MADGLGFFIPEAYEELIAPLSADLSIERGSLRVIVSGVTDLLIPGFLIKGRQRKLDPLMARLGFVERAKGFYMGHFRMCNVYAPPGVASFDITTYFTGQLIKRPVLAQEMKDTLSIFSSIAGKPFVFHDSDENKVAPFPADDDAIHVIFGASPPGVSAKVSLSRMCGVQLVEGGLVYRMPGYARGYGTLIRDADDNIIGQIVGNTIYLFLVLNDDFLRLLPDSGPGLFRRVLAAAWNEFIKIKPDEEASSISDPAICLVQVGAWEFEGLKEFDAQLKERDKELKEAEEKYTEALAGVRLWKMIREGAINEAERRKLPEVIEEHIQGWNAILTDPRVTSVTIVDEAFHIQTAPIVQEHDGKQYNLGRFVIRVSGGASLSVWNLDTLHPKRIPHPHISDDGVICFGNFSLTIKNTLQVQRDFAAAIGMMLELLAEGYDHTLTAYPITEWPEEK